MAVTQDHVHLRCGEFDAALRFFTDNFGAEETGRLPSGTVELRIGGIVYKVSPKPAAQAVPANEFYHLGFVTDDLPGDVEKLKAKGVKIAREPEYTSGQRPYAFVEGPDGIHIELLSKGDGNA